MAVFHKNILKIGKTFLWAENFGGNLSCQWLLPGSKFGNFTKARKYVLYTRRKNSFCHNEVYKGIK